MKLERDVFLNVVIGDEYCSFKPEHLLSCKCASCGLDILSGIHDVPDFSTWSGLGKLLPFAKEQDWWNDFLSTSSGFNSDNVKMIRVDLMEPDKFADAVYQYLKFHGEKETNTIDN